MMLTGHSNTPSDINHTISYEIKQKATTHWSLEMSPSLFGYMAYMYTLLMTALSTASLPCAS